MANEANETKHPRRQVSSTVGGPDWNEKREQSDGPASEAEKDVLDNAGAEETPTNYRQTP